MKKKQFFRNFASIATFGVLGTYIAFAVIACVLYAFSKLPNVLNFSVGNAQILCMARLPVTFCEFGSVSQQCEFSVSNCASAVN